jgi:hypothetical protein
MSTKCTIIDKWSDIYEYLYRHYMSLEHFNNSSYLLHKLVRLRIEYTGHYSCTKLLALHVFTVILVIQISKFTSKIWSILATESKTGYCLNLSDCNKWRFLFLILFYFDIHWNATFMYIKNDIGYWTYIVNIATSWL